MLELFRRYQRYIFLVITFCVVISFSFFGTYSVMPALQSHQTTAFTAVNGSHVSNTDVEELSRFIATDAFDKWSRGGEWGPNFLNDGVVRKDILEKGIGLILADQFSNDLAEELSGRFAKEQRYRPYQHQGAPFLNASGVWAYFAPTINSGLKELQQQPTPTTKEALQARIALYLAEQNFPSYFLRQLLMKQEQQYNWLQQDPELQTADLSLFGYKNLQDWFGSRFVNLVAEFIINSAIQAEALGYQIPRGEVVADLIRNATVSFQQQKNNPRLGVNTPMEYYKQQLQLMGLDQNRAVALWRQVMLFRRLYEDQGSTPLVDRNAIEKFEAYARDAVEGIAYTTAKPLQLSTFRLLQQLEGYIKAVAPPQSDLLAMPQQFFDIDTVAKSHPELVQHRYLVELSKIDKTSLIGKVSLKDMWDWQISDIHWKELQAYFPPLAVQQAKTPEERQAILDALDSNARDRINQIARIAIVAEHPEWIDEALATAPVTKQEIGLTAKETEQPLVGIRDGAALIALLASEDTIPHYSGDNKNYYRIHVLERQGRAVLTFGDAIARKALDQVPDLPYTELIAAIQSDASLAGAITSTTQLTGDRAASLRLFRHVRHTEEKIRSGVENKEPPIKEPLAAQWELESSPFTETYAFATPRTIDRTLAFQMLPGSWSPITTPPNGAMSFFTVKKKLIAPMEKELRLRVQRVHNMLTAEAQSKLATALLATMVEHHAIDLSFMDKAAKREEVAPDANPQQDDSSEE